MDFVLKGRLCLVFVFVMHYFASFLVDFHIDLIALIVFLMSCDC